MKPTDREYESAHVRYFPDTLTPGNILIEKTYHLSNPNRSGITWISLSKAEVERAYKIMTQEETEDATVHVSKL